MKTKLNKLDQLNITHESMMLMAHQFDGITKEFTENKKDGSRQGHVGKIQVKEKKGIPNMSMSTIF